MQLFKEVRRNVMGGDIIVLLILWTRCCYEFQVQKQLSFWKEWAKQRKREQKGQGQSCKGSNKTPGYHVSHSFLVPIWKDIELLILFFSIAFIPPRPIDPTSTKAIFQLWHQRKFMDLINFIRNNDRLLNVMTLWASPLSRSKSLKWIRS